MFRKLSSLLLASGIALGGSVGFGVAEAQAQDRTPRRVIELPIVAQYCAILRALTSRPDQRCPDILPGTRPTRGLVIIDPTLTQTRGMVAAPAPAGVSGVSLARGFSHAALPATGNPGENGYFIQFAFDSAELGDDYKAHLVRLAEVLNTDTMKNSCIRVIGHTDTVGSPDYNLGLSDRRAASVRTYMTSTLGLGLIRVGSVGRGESMPLEDVPGGHPKNRRVEILSRDLALGCG